MTTPPVSDFLMAGHMSTKNFVALSLTSVMVLAALLSAPVGAAPVAVRFPEGVTHGFLLVRSLAGVIIGQGEMKQVAKGRDLVESHLVFDFKDGSLHDEKVVFSQKEFFMLISYRLIQHGPSFPDQIDVSVDRGTGEYTIRSQAGEDGKKEVLTGVLDLPEDVYNGMVVTILLNLPQGADERVSFLAFTPKPEVIQLVLLPMDESSVQIGDLSRKALQYEFRPDIGMVRKLLDRATGKLPRLRSGLLLKSFHLSS